MAVRTVKRRGERRLVIDIRYRNADGSSERYRKDAEVQTLAAARAEERRRLASVALTGSPFETITRASTTAPEPTATVEPAKTSPRLEEVAEQYLGSFAKSQLKPSTQWGYSKVIRGFLIPRLGKLPIHTIDASHVRTLDTELIERGTRTSTRRNVQTVLRSVLCRYAAEAKLLDGAPALPRLPKVGAKIVKVLSEEEVRHILAAARERYRLAFLLAAYAGLRAGEVRGLRHGDVDLKAGALVVRQSICHGIAAAPKSGHERIVPLVPELRMGLRLLPPKGRSELVFQTSEGTPFGEYQLRKAFQTACRRAGLEGWRFHDLRHYFVTALFGSGTPAPTVQALAGHAHLMTTERYAHVRKNDLVDAIRRLAGATSG